MKSILIFVDWFEPGYKAGGPIRSISGFVDNFKDDFQLYLVTRDRDLNSDTAYDEIETDKWLSHSNNVSLMYLSPGKHMSKLSLILSEDYDWIYLNSFFSFKYSVLPYLLSKLKRINQGKFLIAPRGELKEVSLGIKAFKKSVFIRTSKCLKLYKDVHWHATSEADKQSIEKVFPNSKFLIASNLSNISNFSARKLKKKNSLKIIFVSRIINYKNLHYAIDIVSKMQSPKDVKFDFYGPIEDKDYFLKCKKMLSQSKFDIEYKGELEHIEVGKTLLDYDVFLFPSLGENYGHVIAEALISGCIVLTSDQTPWTDLQTFDAGWSIPLNNSNHFVDRLNELYRMKSEDFSLKQNSVKNYVKTRINTEDTLIDYFNFFSSN